MRNLYHRDESSRLLFDLLANCGVVSDYQMKEVLKIPKNHVKDYIKKGLIEKILFIEDGYRKTSYGLTVKGRRLLKGVTEAIGEGRLYVSKSITGDSLLTNCYLSLTKEERDTWINRENLFESMNEAVDEFKMKFPEEYREIQKKFGIAPCNACYKDKSGEMIYITVVTPDSETIKKKDNYALMMKKLNQNDAQIHYKILRKRRGEYIETLEW